MEEGVTKVLELMVDTGERLIVGFTVALTAEAFTVDLGSKTTELVLGDTVGNTASVELTLTEIVDDILICGVGTKLG